jgi:hypothetical protein
MKNIRITLRLSPEQLAHGLWAIRQLEPTYKLSSLNDLVKTIYLSWLTKISPNKSNTIPQSILDEITQFINMPAVKQITLKEIISINKEA